MCKFEMALNLILFLKNELIDFGIKCIVFANLVD